MGILVSLSISCMFFLVGVFLLRREISFRNSAVAVIGRSIGYRRRSFVTDEALQHGYYLEATFKCPFTQENRTARSTVGRGLRPRLARQEEVVILVHENHPHRAKIASHGNFVLCGAFFFMAALWLALAVLIP